MKKTEQYTRWNMRILQDLLHVMTVTGVLSTEEETRHSEGNVPTPLTGYHCHPLTPQAYPNILIVPKQNILMKPDLGTGTEVNKRTCFLSK